jgi:head-tail adaptor
MAIAAGRLTSRVRLERQSRAADAYGNVLTVAWADLGSRWADVRPEAGREALAAGRLESTTRAVIIMRRCFLTLQLTAADRLVVTAGPMAGKVFNIRSIASPTMSEVEASCETGVAS